MSIQLALDGHSFSISDAGAPRTGEAEVEVLTPRTTLVPADRFDADRAAGHLAAAGLAPAAGECVVHAIGQEIAAVMALPREALRQLHERFGRELRFTTPLLAPFAADTPAVWIRRTAGLLYIKVYDDGLRYAEVVPAADEAEALYLFERFGGVFPTERYTLHLADEATAGALRKVLRKRFKRIVACA